MLTGHSLEEQFGRNLKISADGSVLAVAAPLNSQSGDTKGRIGIYQFKDASWQLLGQEILPGKQDFRYGEVMELSADGTKLLVASPFQTVYLYSFNGQAWVKSGQVMQLEDANDLITSIAITPDATRIAIAHECNQHKTICIKFFSLDGNQWLPDSDELTPYPTDYIYIPSLSLSADGNTVVIGHHNKDSRQYRKAGEVTFFKREAGQWKQQATKFTGNTLRSHLGTGVELSKNGTTLVASSSNIDILELNAGFVETYTLSGSDWTNQLPVLKPSQHNSYFGHSVSLSADGTVLAISAPYVGFAKPGYVKVFSRKPKGWKEIASITDTHGIEVTKPANNTTGWSIALSSDGKTLAIGFPHNDESGDMSGKVLVYDLTPLL